VRIVERTRPVGHTDVVSDDRGARDLSSRVPPVAILLVVLLLAPLALWSRFAQDAVPFVVAGELVADSPDQIYTTGGDIFLPPPLFAERSCEIAPAGTDCPNQIVAFVSPPTAIPLAIVTSWFGAQGGPALLRLVTAASLAVGLWILRKRVVAHDPDADRTFLVATLLLVPMIMVPLALGQTSPLLFLSAAVGLHVARRSQLHAAGVGILWGATVAIKLSPLFLLPVLLWRRQWAVAAWGLGVAAVSFLVTLPIGGADLLDPFRESLLQIEDGAARNPYNGSLESFVHAIAPDLTGSGGQSAVLWAMRATILVAAVLIGRKIIDEDIQWAWAWSVCLLFVPLVWWHYVWVTFAGLVLVLATRPPEQRPWRLLVVYAAASIPMSLLNGTDDALPVAQFLFLVASVVVITVLAPKADPPGWLTPPGRTAPAEVGAVAGIDGRTAG
jgi:hypothetical protein